MMNKMIKFIPAFIVAMLMISCSGGTKKEATDLAKDSLIINDSAVVSEEEVLMLISAIPNPVEMSSLLHKSGVVFSSELLNPTANISNYNTNFKKALNMGIYGADLVHMNIYDKTISTLIYLKNIQDLASDLKVEQFFNYSTLKRLSQNNGNTDSVLLITSTGFDKMNHFLQEGKRTNISVLIGFGTWIESMYLATNYQKVVDKDVILERIAGQKFVIDLICQMLDRYNKDENIKQLIKDIIPLKTEFNNVSNSIEYAKPTRTTKDGKKVVHDNSTTKVNISEETFKGIIREVKIIRNKLIS